MLPKKRKLKTRMKMKNILSKFICEVLKEVDIEQVGGLKGTRGSTHVMNTGTIDGEHHYIKFSNDWSMDGYDPSLQILVEYLAYTIYQLYPSISIPQKIDLVFDKSNKQVGLATSSVKGKMALRSVDPEKLGKMMSAGVYVDIFLANWDVVGNGSGNVIVDEDYKTATRIDPGAAMSFRAQGARKGANWNAKASEMDSMLNPNFQGAGRIFQYADLDKAAAEFISVSWGAVDAQMNKVNQYISSSLERHGMHELKQQWEHEFSDIRSKLADRHKVIAKNVAALTAA